MAEDFKAKVEKGEAKWASSGFSGKGFTFDDTEQSESQQVCRDGTMGPGCLFVQAKSVLYAIRACDAPRHMLPSRWVVRPIQLMSRFGCNAIQYNRISLKHSKRS